MSAQPSTAKLPPTVEIEHWVNDRMPKDHHLYDRWSVIYEGRALQTFSTEAEARAVVRGHGWVIREERRVSA